MTLTVFFGEKKKEKKRKKTVKNRVVVRVDSTVLAGNLF